MLLKEIFQSRGPRTSLGASSGNINYSCVVFYSSIGEVYFKNSHKVVWKVEVCKV